MGLIFDKEVRMIHNLEMDTEGAVICVDENNGFLFQNRFIPEEVVSTILSYLDARELLNGRLVCQAWKNIIDTTVLKLKAKRTKNMMHVSQSSFNKLPWYVFYAICKYDSFNRNLLLNGCGQDHLNHWNILANGGNKWTVENPPTGSDPVPALPMEFDSHQSCFATSYSDCVKQQLIPLVKYGLTDKIMDEIQPVIEIIEWHTGRFDCGCQYELLVRLLNERKKPMPHLYFTYKDNIPQWEDRSWKKVMHEFSNYGRGVRYVEFTHSGSDSQFWNGHYGSKMTGARVIVKLPQYQSPPSSSSSSESSESDINV